MMTPPNPIVLTPNKNIIGDGIPDDSAVDYNCSYIFWITIIIGLVSLFVISIVIVYYFKDSELFAIVPTRL